MVTTGILPHKGNLHGRAENRTRGLVISSQKLWPLDHEAGRSTHAVRAHTVVKLTRRVSFKKMSQLDGSLVLQKTLRFESPLWETDKGTNSQAGSIPVINDDKMKHSYFSSV